MEVIALLAPAACVAFGALGEGNWGFEEAEWLRERC